jgi:tetratricopeptide (TPR) repeat protein
MEQQKRIEKLLVRLSQNPNDSFLLYALGMEYKSLGDFPKTLNYFERVIASDAGFVPVYLQKAMVHRHLGELTKCRFTLEAGLSHAIESSQLHARDKMIEMLEMLE